MILVLELKSTSRPSVVVDTNFTVDGRLLVVSIKTFVVVSRSFALAVVVIAGGGESFVDVCNSVVYSTNFLVGVAAVLAFVDGGEVVVDGDIFARAVVLCAGENLIRKLFVASSNFKHVTNDMEQSRLQTGR